MAQVTVPPEVSGRITRIEHELWAPGQITHRLRSGAIDGPLLRGSPRWRGIIEIGVRPSWIPARQREAAAIDLFMSLMTRPGCWCNMPWGGDAPFFPTVDTTYRATITTAETAADGFTITRSAGTTMFQVGDWIHIGGRVGIVREIAEPVMMQPATEQRGMRVLPDIAAGFGVTTPVFRGDLMRMRFPSSNEDTITNPRTGSFAGPWILPWEEYLGR